MDRIKQIYDANISQQRECRKMAVNNSDDVIMDNLFILNLTKSKNEKNEKNERDDNA